MITSILWIDVLRIEGEKSFVEWCLSSHEELGVLQHKLDLLVLLGLLTVCAVIDYAVLS